LDIGRFEPRRERVAQRLDHKAVDVQEHVISELLGHAVSSLAVGRYGKKLEPSRLSASVERLTLPL
jgi:hypothetical protein